METLHPVIPMSFTAFILYIPGSIKLRLQGKAYFIQTYEDYKQTLLSAQI